LKNSILVLYIPKYPFQSRTFSCGAHRVILLPAANKFLLSGGGFFSPPSFPFPRFQSLRTKSPPPLCSHSNLFRASFGPFFPFSFLSLFDQFIPFDGLGDLFEVKAWGFAFFSPWPYVTLCIFSFSEYHYVPSLPFLHIMVTNTSMGLEPPICAYVLARCENRCSWSLFLFEPLFSSPLCCFFPSRLGTPLLFSFYRELRGLPLCPPP